MIEGKPRCVVVANGDYVTLPKLDRAVPDAEDLEKTLQSTHHYPTEVLPNFERGALLDWIDKHLGKDALVDGSLILVWIGHGAVGADHTLRMLVRSGQDDVQAAKAGDLGEWAARTGARQSLVVIDTCFSGTGVVEAARLADAVNSGRASPGKAWFGVVAASLGDEPARSGALVRELVLLLRDGPREADFRWDRTRPYICGDDFLNALLAGWSEQRQRPHKLTVGLNWDFVRNPRFEPGIPDQPIEHLLQAARGGSGDESYFTGRESALAKIVTWIGRRTPSLLVLTGPPGCGKSAVSGRIVSLSSSIERAKLLAAAPIPAELDPGADCVDMQLQARGFTVELASEQLARQLGLDVRTGSYGILAEARRRREEKDPLVLVVDGLDEAGTNSSSLAVELISPLAREALVLVATRDVPSGDKTLISQLGPAAVVLDLGQDVEGTRRDIANYVKRRLAGAATAMNPDLIAEELAAGGGANAPQFLLARLVTSQLRERPVDTSADGWRLALATTVESALERDLQSVVLTIADKPHPTAAREMICALSLAHGGGFPADELWPAVATAISPTSTSYTREDVYEVLTKFGRHLIAGSDGGQPVYRIAHQSLVDYVRGNATLMVGTESKTAAHVATAILAQYDRLLDAGFRPRDHSYLWRHAWRHLAEAGSSGLAGLRHLVERDREVFLPHLASGLGLASGKSLAAGQIPQALEFIQEAVGIRRQLGDNLALAMELFTLTFVQTAAGDEAKADEAAAEAAKLARAAGDRPEGRAVLGATLFARSHSLLVNGHFKSALVLAQEAVELIETGDTGDPYKIAAAYNIKGQAAFALGDLETAATACERAVDIFDEQRNPDAERDLRVEPLAVLANIEVIKSALSFPDASGKYSATVMPAARRMLLEYRREGSQGTIKDIIVSSGIQAFVRASIMDRLRGIEAPDPDELRSILKEAIGLVRPFAGQVPGAALTLAEGAILFLKVDAAGAASDSAYAEEYLRPMADSNDSAAYVLGQLLDATNAISIAQFTQGAGGDASTIVARQREVVTLLRRSNLLGARIALAGALSKLGAMLALGDDELASAVRSEGIEVWRGLLGRFPDARAQLVALLCDQAASLSETRTAEAIDLAREAVSEAESLPQPQYAGLVGMAETYLAVALRIEGLPKRGIPPEVRDLLQRAVKHLEPLVPHADFSGFLAVACLNLAQTELLDRRCSEAVAFAERAVALLDSPDIRPMFLPQRPKALLSLGQAQRESGQVELGTQTLRKEIDRLRAAAGDSESGGVFALAGALNGAAPDFWDEVLEGFADRPDLQRALNILRFRPPSDMAATVGALVDALATAPNTKHRFLRQLARSQRARAPEEFDAAWRDKTGVIPPWLKLDRARERLLIAWWNAQNCKLSRDYLKSHPALLDADTNNVLEEMGLEESKKDLVNLRRALLDDCRELGVDAAYAPLLADLEIGQWMQSKDPARYLAEHAELLRPEITTILRDQATKGYAGRALVVSILDLAHRGESELAFQATREPVLMHAQLRAAWRSTDITRLASLATIVQGCTEDAWTKRVSTLVLAIARTLEHTDERPDSSIALALEGSSESDRKELAAIIGDAIQYHPASAFELARLIYTISDTGRNLG
jgi:tetratricopeptide (TPR) repeat protein